IGKFGQIRGKAYLDLLDSDGNGSFDDSIDTVLRLFDESGNELAIDDDGGEGLLSRLEYVFTTAGTYYLGVSGHGNSTYNINTLPDAVDSDLSRRPGSTGSSQLSIILQPNTAPQNPKGGGATTATDADGYIHTNLPSFNLTQTNTGSSNFISLQRNIGNDDQVAVGATDVDFVKVNFQGTGTTSRILTATARGIGTGKSAVMP
ncbi:pre-peptidase C-terminal domain-containing protein, partial [Cylindrospermopsis raciborskii]|uniref:pre-peptidase C-terminal domain-containing protein n=1 Tax=Cylindrospermopsis raciborskii TaxID=77022 RepID=UPI001F0DE9A9